MDVVLTPVGAEGDTWSLTDRLRRRLGTVRKSGDFEIVPEPGTSLVGIKGHHASLDDVMTEIARRLGGACSLDSQDWD